MSTSITRRAFAASAAAVLASPALIGRASAADEPLTLRCSLETAPSHTRNGTVRDYLGKIQVEMADPGSWTFTGIVPDADFFQLPALYGRPIDVVHRAVDGEAGQLLAAQIEQKLKSHVIGPSLDLGFFNWYSTSKRLASYSDLKGLKIRNAGGAGQAWRTQFMGAIPNTTPLPNVALALSQGTFDGLITSNETIASGQFWESGIRHALEDHQFMAEYIPIVSLAFWQKLSPDQQEMMSGLWKENIATYRANMAAAQMRARDAMQAHEIKFTVPSSEEIAAVRRKMMSEQEQFVKAAKISPEMVSAIMAELGDAD
jgi:C4-dicarboxylate-binding protein DctP